MPAAGRRSFPCASARRKSPSVMDRLVDRLMAGSPLGGGPALVPAGDRGGSLQVFGPPEAGCAGSCGRSTSAAAILSPGWPFRRRSFLPSPAWPVSRPCAGPPARRASARGSRPGGRHYLETGRRPRAGRRRKSDPEMDWPLPACEVEVPAPLRDDRGACDRGADPVGHSREEAEGGPEVVRSSQPGQRRVRAV